MTDYGHELRFGTFLTPQNTQPDAVVELAALTEAVGLDLVTFQDHPYQSGFLDTWTLLTWVAAKTERVRLSGNVLNLPLRPPAVLARSAASLDLLSGGRVELGLGAGGFSQAIEAMGGPSRTPAQSREALGEAIDIIRGVWNPGQRSRAGQHHHRRNRDCEWTRSTRHPPVAQRRSGAGEPRHVAPLRSRPWGSTFILSSDEPDAISAWGHATAPSLRKAVAGARASSTTGSNGSL